MSDDRPGQKTSIRFSDADYDLFREAAETEGFEGILQWLLITGRKRARLVANKGAIRVTEVIVPPPEQSRIEPK